MDHVRESVSYQGQRSKVGVPATGVLSHSFTCADKSGSKGERLYIVHVRREQACVRQIIIVTFH